MGRLCGNECAWIMIVVLLLAFSVSSVKWSCGMVIYLLSLLLVMSNLKKGATAAPKTVLCSKVGSTEENLFFENASVTFCEKHKGPSLRTVSTKSNTPACICLHKSYQC